MPSPASRLSLVIALTTSLAVLPACATRLERKLVPPERAATLNKKSTYLKAHMRNGELYVLTSWQVLERDGEVQGRGDYFDVNRKVVGSGRLRVRIADVALFETNVEKVSSSIAGMTVVTILSAVITIACITNPKACFGSCPTFYVTDGDKMVLQAEGFSSSIAPALEKRDIDALYRAKPHGRTVSLRVTNEALETHVIRRADLLVVPRPEGGRVFATEQGRFWAASHITTPSRCTAAEGDCVDAVSAVDVRERSSTTDGVDLATREYVELEFDAPPRGKVGLVIGARQTFLTTFLFYQALAFMGHDAVARLAALERGDPDMLERVDGIHEMLGAIEVQLRGADDEWTTVGEFDETGPISLDVKVVELPDGVDPSRVRLRLTRGHWRLDYLALVRLDNKVAPVRLQPVRVTVGGNETAAVRADLVDPERALTTTPGDEYMLEYELPDEAAKLELFLDSKGYYLEWMREEWLREHSPAGAAIMLYAPAQALRWLAPRFKAMEPQMEELFWSSRYAK